MSQIIGKIIFYNVNEGKGIILTEATQKYPFEIIDWDDFNNTPKVGMLVVFSLQDALAKNIVMAEDNEPEEVYAVLTDNNDVADEDEVMAVSVTILNDNERPSKISLDISIDEAIHQYFFGVEKNIQERTTFQSSKKRLDFLRIRRFLFTTYNNLTELDTTFITDEIKQVRDDLIQMSRVYDDYKVKTTFPDVAFENIFLAKQSEYVHIKKESELTFKKIQKLRLSEQFLSRNIEEREEVLKTILRSSSKFIRLNDEFKNIKGEYVDTVHMIAVYEEEYHEDMKLLHEFELEYKESFLAIFTTASKKYRKQILYILDAQAFAFDAQLWRQAKKSKVIKRFFEQAHIKGDYSAKLYLKYYLNTLDPQIVSNEQSDLFELLKYLESVEHKTAIAIFRDIDDALRIKYLVSKLPFDLEVETFVDEKKALIWAEQNSYSLIIVSEILQSMYGCKFLEKLYRRSQITAKIVMIGEGKHSIHPQIKITTTLPYNFRDKELLDTISTLYNESKENDE